jgi:NADPH:quinone reductase-like Zn-dependent oxidoreductase
VNFNDLLVFGGKFPVHSTLPSFAGNEGVGRIEAVGPGVTEVVVGDRVILPLYSFTWRERMIVPSVGLFALPEEIDVQQAALLRINPPTAILLLDEYVPLTSGDWIVQNAVNSGVGRSVVAAAKSRGIRTVNLVRRREAIAEVKAIGGDVVLLDEPGIAATLSELTGGAEIRLAIDGVCGTATARLIACLAQGGALVNYAQMSGDLTAPGDLLSMKRGLSIHGFYQALPRFKPKIPAIMREVVEMAAAGNITQPIGRTYKLSEVKEAVAAVVTGTRVIFDVRAT